MLKAKRKQEVEPVAKVAEAPAKAAGIEGGDRIFPSPIAVKVDESPLLTLYAAILASLDWQRDVRKPVTICRHAYGIAEMALEVFTEKQKTKESK